MKLTGLCSKRWLTNHVPVATLGKSRQHLYSGCMSSVVFREVEGQPIVWRDSHGTVHACEGTELHPGIFVYWTLCEIDVPAGMVEPGEREGIICAICRERMILSGPTIVPEAGEAEEAEQGPENFVRLLIRKPKASARRARR